MAIVRYETGQNSIYNGLGCQVAGSLAYNQDGLSPRELIEASVALCISITLEGLLRRDGLLRDDTRIKVDVQSAKDPGGENRLSSFAVSVAFPEYLEEAYIQKAMVIIERGCTLSNTVKHAATVEMRRLEEPQAAAEGMGEA